MYICKTNYSCKNYFWIGGFFLFGCRRDYGGT